MTEKINWYPAAVGTHFAGLPVTDGKWVEDRDRKGTLRGYFEMFEATGGRWFSVPDASRYIHVTENASS